MGELFAKLVDSRTAVASFAFMYALFKVLPQDSKPQRTKLFENALESVTNLKADLPPKLRMLYVSKFPRASLGAQAS